MEYKIRIVEFEQLDNAFKLIWKTFRQFVAPDYAQEGIEIFNRNGIATILI